MNANEKAVFDTDGLAIGPGFITIYNFDPLTGLFVGTSEEYVSQGVGIPAHSTINAPPEPSASKVNICIDGVWKEVADHRGESVWSTSTGEMVTIMVPGDYPADTTPLKPSTEYDVWNGQSWVTDTVAQRDAEIKAAETEKSNRINETREVTQAWQTQLLLGIITDADKALLTEWMKYYQDVQAIDTSKAPDIVWPQKPE